MAELIHKLFSSQCRLTALRLDIDTIDKTSDFYRQLDPLRHSVSNSIFNQTRCCCITLRYLYIRVEFMCTIVWIIEHVPALKCLSVHFINTLRSEPHDEWIINNPIQSKKNWFDKVRQIQMNFWVVLYGINYYSV
jgi:hypothetical protein